MGWGFDVARVHVWFWQSHLFFPLRSSVGRSVVVYYFDVFFRSVRAWKGEGEIGGWVGS